ncbi:hypothetical protein BJ138DRAFT_565041 [Hygrophoropsis aurantiaca]|uniref:Uncharacterized protein n=1 Tax=Hygrophoropsis aurantiaca TaxID=72124 RepID=A0ACB8A1U1_9AGAM|nr:hypothetical protein BJ138DRAFT_565041 [Hygrophoropsis aurantiaca]
MVVLTFSQEVDLIWDRQWSFMTALYFIARYSGDLLVIGCAAWNICINWTLTVNENMSLAFNWAGNIFLLTMQVMLVIRVYALLNQSKKVLIFLATSYVLQATALFVLTVLPFNKRVFDGLLVSLGPAIGSVMQPLTVNPSAKSFVNILGRDATILSVVFDTILLLFALWAFVKHALEAKTLDGGWSINVLVRTLVADQLLYFICYLAWQSLSVTTNYNAEFDIFGILVDNVLAVFNALVVVAGPRMVISLRTTENKMRGEGGTLEGEVSTVRFGIREPPTQSESDMEEGGGLQATDANAQID